MLVVLTSLPQRNTNMRKMSDEELLEEGVSQDLIDWRREFNDRIKDGYCMFKGIKIERAFVSNPCGYDKVFLRTVDGSIIEHGIDPNKLVREII